MTRPYEPVREPMRMTRTGIVIGCAHVPQRPLHSFTRSEEAIQRALLAPPPVPRVERIAGVVLAVAIGIAFGWLLALHLSEP